MRHAPYRLVLRPAHRLAGPRRLRRVRRRHVAAHREPPDDGASFCDAARPHPDRGPAHAGRHTRADQHASSAHGHACAHYPTGWSPLAAENTGPAPRYDHTAILDPQRQQLVVFGGRGAQVYGDTWLFDLAARTWREVTAPGPAPRFGHGAVYDAAGRRMLVVMGQAGADFFNDVWAFDLDAEAWTELKANEIAAGQPRPRYGQSAALDGQGRILISHGFSDQGRFDDTWLFDPASGAWSQLPVAGEARPLRRCLHQLAYDETTNRLILFGGCSSGYGPCPQGDLWALDLQTNTWSELQPAGDRPSARTNASLVYDGASGRLLLFGGETDVPDAEAWAYDLAGNAWTRLDLAPGPSARTSHAAGVDPAARRIVVFGGKTADGLSADVWVWGY